MTVARVALPVAAWQPFDYWVPQGARISPGAVVKVRLAGRRLPGVVVDTRDDSEVERAKLLAVDEVEALPALPDDVRELCRFVSSYYHVPPGLALALALPPLAAAARARREHAQPLVLTDEGRAALPPRTTRAPVARALYERLLQAPEGLAPAEVAALSPTGKRTLARWRESGFVREAAVRCAEAVSATLNGEQASAADAIVGALGAFSAFLLQGITGSGKTEVYIAAARACIEAGGQALLLVPEINLTPQLVARVTRALPGARSVTLHSGLASGERRANWLAAARGDADLVLGTRLAVFAPLPRLGLVVVDEEHDASYKQQDVVRYHARDAAVWRARRRAVPVVLGSATPSLETYAHAKSGRYVRLLLSARASGAIPVVRFVPSRGTGVRDGLSPALVAAIGERLARGEQSLVFVNRRGYAPALKCAACGWEAGCPRCSARLTAHRVPPALVCHHCGHRERIAAACPSCGNVDLMPAGHGTQRLEQAIASAFPCARIARVDRDSTRLRDAFAAVKARVERNELDILVGTQMLAKGHDFPRLTLVGVLGADNALYSADFRATERLAALLVQVAGRAGRSHHAGEVIVQTDFPGHPVFAALAAHDYDAFADALLDERAAAGLPPFSHLALVTAEAHRRDDADGFLANAHDEAMRQRGSAGADVDVFAPVAAPLARRAGFERSQMLLRGRRRADLQKIVAALRTSLDSSAGRRVRWAIDIDPASVA